MKKIWVGAVVSLALACPVAYAEEDAVSEPVAQAQENVAQPVKPQGGVHKKHKRRHGHAGKKKHHHPKHHHHQQHHKHHAKKHEATPAEKESAVEQKIDQETELNNR